LPPASDEHAFQRFKWTVLDEAAFHHNAGIAYYWASRAFPDRSVEELDPLVRRALLELLDDGLIFFHWGGWGNGCDLDPRTAKPATRAEVEADLARGGDAEPIPQTVWFTTTDAGDAKRATIPADVLLDYEERQEWQAFNERHPEYRQKLDAWVEASGRWVREGSRRPTHPRLDYEDYPGPRQATLLDPLPGSRLGTFVARLSDLSSRLRHRRPV
jgi:hypothetical protein